MQATRRLVEEHGVFALVGSVGTEQSLAARDYLNAARVPQLFAASGATSLGELRRYPWTIGFQPSHRAEGSTYGRYLARAAPDATVAVLFQDDDYGRELLAGLREGIARSRVKVVATQRYEAATTDVQPQVGRLKVSGASVLALFATTRAVTQAQARLQPGWRPRLVVVSADGRPAQAAEGSISLGFLKDPAMLRWRDDPAIRLYRTLHGPVCERRERRQRPGRVRNGRRLRDRKVLSAAGQSPTRAVCAAHS